MKSLFQKIEELIPTLHGWCSVEKAISLASYTLALRPKIVCEIGTWGGRSAIPMIMACQSIGSGKVICIDPWKPEESAKGQGEDDRKWWNEVANHEVVYQQFDHLIGQLGLRGFCEVVRLPANEAPVHHEIDLLHIDGNHGPQALVDTQRFAPSVRVQGICVLDDLNWNGGYVRQSEAWLLEHGFLKLHELGTGAVYLRVK